MTFIAKLGNKLKSATLYSIDGLKSAFKEQSAFRLEILGFICALILSPLVGKSRAEKLLLIAVVALILIVELLNSAIETVVNRISLEHNDLSGRAKDLGSAAVFLSVLLAIFVWAIVLFS